MAWIEHAASPLPRECSTTELHGHLTGTQTTAGAGEGNRTLVISLEGFCSTIELHPRTSARQSLHHSAQPLRKAGDDQAGVSWWRGKDSNLRRQSRQIYSLIPLTAREPLQQNRRLWRYHWWMSTISQNILLLALSKQSLRGVASTSAGWYFGRHFTRSESCPP